MVRTVNEAAHRTRRNAILDAAQRAVETKGRERNEMYRCKAKGRVDCE